MRHRPALYLKSALCTFLFNLHGVRCSVMGCEGLLPVLYNQGEVVLEGKLGIGGRLVRCEIGASSPDAYLRVGHNVYLNNGASVVANCGIEIGTNTFIGDFATIYDSNFHSMDSTHPPRSAPVSIGANVWLGRNVTVLPGSKIGDHTVVSAGSVVRGDLPPAVLAAGTPAVPVKNLDISDGWLRQ